MQTRDEVEGLHNGREFSQALEFLSANTGKNVFYCFYEITFPRKKAKLSCLTVAGLAQSVERLTAERKVAGSIPGAGPLLRVLK